MILLSTEISSFFSQVSADAWVQSVGTLIGALIGAFLGAKGAMKASEKQIKAQEKRDISTFVKNYTFLKSEIEKLAIVLESISARNPPTEKLIKDTLEQTDEKIKRLLQISGDKIPDSKFEVYFDLLSDLTNIKIMLEMYKNYDSIDNKELFNKTFKDEIQVLKDNNYLLSTK